MNNDRLMHLLKNAVEHIVAFEDKESENVLKALGFTESELLEIKFIPDFDEEDKTRLRMVEGKVFRHGEVIWELNYSGNEYITSNAPFKKYSHYFYHDDDRDSYIGYAYYSPTDSYVQQFDTLDECLEWLVPDLSREDLERRLIETKGNLGLWQVLTGTYDLVFRITDDGSGYCNSIEKLSSYYKGDEIALVNEIIKRGNCVFFEDYNTGEKKSYEEYLEQFKSENSSQILPYVNFETFSKAKEVLGLLHGLEMEMVPVLDEQIGDGEKEDWVLTDPDCLQLRRQPRADNSKVFELIQVDTWPMEDKMSFMLAVGEIDLKDYTDKEIKSTLSSYGYNNMEALVRAAGSEKEAYGQLAEMFFEIYTKDYYICEFDSWNAAVDKVAERTGMDLAHLKKVEKLDLESVIKSCSEMSKGGKRDMALERSEASPIKNEEL